MTRSTDPEVLSAYFATMRQFLATQSRVMSSFLGTQPAGTDLPALPVQMPASMPVDMPLPFVAEAKAPAPAFEAPPPIVAPAPISPPAMPVHAMPVATPAANDRDAPSRAGLVDLLLGLVEEKTGYPRDMVGLEQNLEADLGIDSIKRIEVVGATLQVLPESMREALTPNRSKLNTQATLNGMLDILVQAAPGASANKAGGSVHELHAEERRRA